MECLRIIDAEPERDAEARRSGVEVGSRQGECAAPSGSAR